MDLSRLSAMERLDENIKDGFVTRVVIRLFGTTKPQSVHAILYGLGDGSSKVTHFVSLLISAVIAYQPSGGLLSSGYNNHHPKDLALRCDALVSSSMGHLSSVEKVLLLS